MNPDIQTIVYNSFQRTTQYCYWHYIVKNYQKKTFYENREAIDKKIKEIAQKLGQNSFERKDAYGLTPMHVAVLTGNREGVRFLLSKGASHSIKDDFNCTPLDYAKNFHKEILDLFPVDLLAPIETELSEIFEKWHVPLDPSPCEYKPHTQDFGIEIQEMLISGTYGRFEQIFAKNGKLALDVLIDHLEDVLGQLGVTVKRTHYPIAVRDHFLNSTNGEVQKLPRPVNVKKSLDRAHSLNFYFNEVGYTRNTNPFLKGFTGATSDLIERTMDIFPNPPELSGYMEGGNTFILTDQNGDPQLLVGREHFYTTLNCRPTVKSDNPSSLSNEKICRVAEKMYAQGLLKINGSVCLMGEEKIVDFFSDHNVASTSSKPEGEGHTLLTMAIEKGLFKRFSLQESQIENAAPLVANYLQRKKETKAYIAKGLNIKPENIQSLPQVMYHLDVFLKPGPKRSVFVQDFSMNIAMIKMLLTKAEILNLTSEDKKLLTRMLTVSEKMHQDLGPLLQKATDKIKEAHLKPVSMPGIFYDTSDEEKSFNFNFMNAISGWSRKTERYYYITSGIQVGDRLGGIFMEMFTKFLKSYESRLDVFFIGGPKENRKDFSNAMTLWNDGQVLSGPHCYSFETKTASHTG